MPIWRLASLPEIENPRWRDGSDDYRQIAGALARCSVGWQVEAGLTLSRLTDILPESVPD